MMRANNNCKGCLIARPFPMVIGIIAILCCAAAERSANAQLVKLLADDGISGDSFGSSVAVSGTTAVVGAYRHQHPNGSSGSAYLFNVRTGMQLAELIPKDAAAGDFFGRSVAIYGSTAIVGAPGDDVAGAAYLFDVNTGAQLGKLVSNDGTSEDLFGISVSISGNTAIVGARGDRINGLNVGSAYLFDVNTGQQISKLTPEVPAGGEEFGHSVAVSGNTAIVGAWADDEDGFQAGAAYLFDATNGSQTAKLTASDGHTGREFGLAVGISGDLAIVGAFDNDNPDIGSAYLFDVTTGAELGQLFAEDEGNAKAFGSSVGISGDTVVVGAWNDDEHGTRSGSAYLFDVATQTQIAKLVPDDGEIGEFFGWSVGVSGDHAVVGSYRDDDNGIGAGSAYVFVVPEPSGGFLLMTAIGCGLRRHNRLQLSASVGW